LTAELSPPILHEGGLPAGLQWLARWMADKYGLMVDLSVEDDLPPAAEDVKILLFESVRELLFNAVKHAHVHAVTVNLRRIGDQEVRLTVSDEGPGFDPAALKPAGTGGVGFGLFSIGERLDMLGGGLEIDSAPGRGSRFILTAPLGGYTEAPAASATPAFDAATGGTPEQVRTFLAEIDRDLGAAEAGATPSPPASVPKVRVMLVDDHTVLRQGLARLLVAAGDFDIVGEAADGLAAVELAREIAPDVILMDLNLPKVNGIDATRMINSARPEIRIIGLSMFEEPEQAQAMIEAGAVKYLTKSGPIEALIAAIRESVKESAETGSEAPSSS